MEKEDASSFLLEPEEVDFAQIGTPIVPENTRTTVLEIVRLSFKKENKWVFSDGAGGIRSARLWQVYRHAAVVGPGKI